jgi:small subunit ribosomal protein S6
MPRAYETMLIVRSDANEETLEQLLSDQERFLKDQGVTELERQKLGKRRFTFEMDRQKEGIYVQMNYLAEPPVVAIWERNLRLNESILRYMTIRQDDK